MAVRRGTGESLASKPDKVLRQLLRDLENGRYPLGGQVPTHRAWARAHGVSVTVVNAAYKEMRRRGMIRAGGRGGTIVISTRAGSEGSARIRESGELSLANSYPILPEA